MRVQGWDGEKAKCLSKCIGCPSAFNLLAATLLKRGLCAPLGRKGLCLTDFSKHAQKDNIKLDFSILKKKTQKNLQAG